MSELDAFKVDLFTLCLEVIKVAEEQPNHRYINTDADNPDNAGCAYSHADGTGCIVGTAMRRLGKALPTKNECDFDENSKLCKLGNGYVSSTTWREILTNESQNEDYELVHRWLMTVQSAQDDRVTWGYALECANKEHRVAAAILRSMMQDAS